MAKKAIKRGPSAAKKRAALRNDSIPRAVLGRELQKQILRFGLSRQLAGRVLDEAASQMSRLMSGHIHEFSADRLVGMLNGLGSSVYIEIKHASKLGRRGRVTVKVK
jgi:predicted XRE-type DNA-binding protein